MARVVVLFLAVLVSIPAPLSALEKRLAVLELLDEGAKLTPFELSALTDDVRAAALVLQPSGYIVMTRESMMAMLGPDGDATLKRCTGASCEVEAGRTLGADLVVVGSVGKFAGDLEARLKLFDTASASLLAQRKAQGADLKALRRALDAETPALFGAVGGGFTPVTPAAVPPASPPSATGAGSPALGDLSIDAKPRELVRLELTDPTGKTEVAGSPYKNPRAQPGTWKVKASAAGYASEERTVSVLADEPTLEKIALNASGALAVTGTPVVAEGGAGVGGPMVSVPAGEFWMGCNPATDKPSDSTIDLQCADPSMTGRTVYLDAYRIDVHEVTVAEYADCVKAGRCTETGLSTPDEQGDWTWACNWGKTGREQHPINCLDWKQATTYCEWAGKRLPTEAEWEKAARGPAGRTYPWGNEPIDKAGKVANILDATFLKIPNMDFPSDDEINMNPGGYDDGFAGTAPVGTYPAGRSFYGALDMIGNVAEWVADVYDEEAYGKLAPRNPRSEAGSAKRVVRGGGLMYPFMFVGASFRLPAEPVSRSLSCGMRCAQSLNGSSPALTSHN